jgi:hypothetical protein
LAIAVIFALARRSDVVNIDEFWIEKMKDFGHHDTITEIACEVAFLGGEKKRIVDSIDSVELAVRSIFHP